MIEPFTSACVYLPGIGQVPINMSDWRASTKINISYTFEYVTGNVSYIMFSDSGAIIQTATCNVASQCPLGQISFGGNASGLLNITSNAGQAVAGAVSGNGALFAKGVSGSLAAGSSMVLSSNTRASSFGGAVGGRLASIWPEISYTEFSIDTEDPDNANYIAMKGRPVALTHAISNHSGYVQCDGSASVSITGDTWERDEINSILNSGFFYE